MLWLLACAPDPGVEDSAGIVVDGPDDVAMNDENSGLQVDIIGGSAPGWLFGAVYPDRGYTDEGCISATDVCHTLDADGGFLDIGTCESPSDQLSCIPVDYYRGGKMTFVLKPSLGSGCWVWGADPSYFDVLGCEETSWANDSY